MEDKTNSSNIIGVDFEGTIVRAGVVKNNQIKMLHNNKISVRQSESYVLNKLYDIIDKVYSKDISGIGLGVPSIVDTLEGIVYQAIDQRGLSNFTVPQQDQLCLIQWLFSG